MEEKPSYPKEPCFKEELTSLINKHSKENGSDTPDWVLANYLCGCLEVFEETVKIRSNWYGHKEMSDKVVFDIKEELEK